MPKQKGLFPITGTMGGYTFYKMKDGTYGVRTAGGVDPKRMATDPAFERVRENGREFARAGKAGRLLRNALRTILEKVADGTVVQRVFSQFMKVLKADQVSNRGERNVLDGETELFRGFEFNAASTLASTLHAPYTVKIDRTTGAATADIPPFVPKQGIASPVNSTHYMISAAAAEIDFETEVTNSALVSSAELPLDDVATQPLALALNLPANSEKPLFLALCIEFLQSVNGKFYKLNNGGFNAMAMVAVDGGA
ncbi:hypothetical protein [Chitinophaga sp. 22620]|uniref:hypothetical protein n=1 Tax=Chitinophaga sp. 22620 TaxID=3453952 RepID=UPI003F84B20B